MSQNEKLSYTLREAREHIAALREEVDKLTAPPSAYGVIVGKNDDGTVDVLTSGRKMRVGLHPEIDHDELPRGSEVVLNDSFNVVLARGGEVTGEVVTIKEVLEDGVRALIVGRADEERVCELADALRGVHLRSGDTMRLDPRSNLLLEKLPRPEVEDLLLEEVPDISYEDIGGLDSQIEQIADAVELPFLYQDLFAEHQLPAPKGILLYGPPGCGKTLIAKAVANSLAKKVADKTGDDKGQSYFINIKGPELLNKYVGETERQIRLVFQRAREKSEEGWPVIVFFDEMDSMFRTRGSGISSRHGVDDRAPAAGGDRRRRGPAQRHRHRRDEPRGPHRPGDPAPRPARREDQDRAAQRRRPPGRSSPATSPTRSRSTPTTTIPSMIDRTVAEMYRDDEDNQFLEVTYQNGDKEILYYKDFSSGAMIENIVRRAKKLAIKRVIAGGARGVRAAGPARLDQAGVQGARGPAEHHQPRRLGEDLRQEGRAHRVHPHARQGQRPRPTAKAAGPSSGSAPGSTCRRTSTCVGCPMAIAKVCGIETEYGILVRGADSNPVSASSLLINAYLVARPTARSRWDFEDERPGNDARGFSVDDLLAPEVETHLVNAVLTNGARYYVDHAHPEICTPECLDGARGRALRPGRRGDRPRHRWTRRRTLPGRRRRDPRATRTTPTARATATAATRTT